jgi:hypothetical protein
MKLSTLHSFAAPAVVAAIALAAQSASAATYNVTTLSNASPATDIGYDPDKPAPTVTTSGFYATGAAATNDYNSIRFTPAAIGMAGLTLGDIQSIVYSHSQAGGGSDWQMKVYTNTTVGQSSGWYGYRLNYDLSTANGDGSFSTFSDTNADGERINTYANRATPTYRLNDPTGYANEVAAAGSLPVMFFDISAGANSGSFDYNTFLQDITVNTASFGSSTVHAVPEPASLAVLGLGSAALLLRRRRNRA